MMLVGCGRETREPLIVGRREGVVEVLLLLLWRGKQGVVVLLRPLEVLVLNPESGHCFERGRLLLLLTQHCLVIHTMMIRDRGEFDVAPFSSGRRCCNDDVRLLREGITE